MIFALIVASFVAIDWLSQRVRILAAMLYLVATGVLVTLHAVYGRTLVGALMRPQEIDAANLFPHREIPGVTRTAICLIGTAAAVWFLLRKSTSKPQKSQA